MSLRIKDLRRSVRGLPRLSLDVAAPEELSPASVVTLPLGGTMIRAYSLERIAGEKLRAFLSSLPAYRSKTGRQAGSVRVKDLYDLSLIARRHPPADHGFWLVAGEEFRLACRSRAVDCAGLETFAQQLTATRVAYEQDPTLVPAIPFTEVWGVLASVMEVYLDHGLVPFEFELPPLSP